MGAEKVNVGVSWSESSRWATIGLTCAATILASTRTAEAEEGPELPANARAIQDAIDAAQPGDVVELPAGRIVGELRIDRAITVRGKGRDRTTFLSRGRRPALVMAATSGRVVLEGVTITTAADAVGHRGAGVMLSGPGRVILRDVALRRTIVGRCLSAAISLRDRPQVEMERVQIEDHHCFMAGAFVLDAGTRVELVDSLLAGNIGDLAGAIYLAGGELSIRGSVLRGNRFARGDDGHHLVFGAGPSRAELVAAEVATDRSHSIAFEKGARPEVSVARMDWPEPRQPAFVQRR